MKVSENHQAYWRKNLRITAILLGIWFVVTFVVGYFARDLNFTFFGWPFSFWVASQGSLVVYVVIIWFYANYMNKLDHGTRRCRGGMTWQAMHFGSGGTTSKAANEPSRPS